MTRVRFVAPSGTCTSRFAPRPRPALLVALLSALYCGPGCKAFRPVVIDTKTQLENQVLGTFERLEQDLILASSVRGKKDRGLSGLQREALEAAMMREFYRDDIEALKDQRVVGEANTGLLLLLSRPASPDQARDAERLIRRENESRDVIMRRAIQLHRDLSEKDLPLVRRIFARLNQETARPGHRVQRPDGRWDTVAAPAAEKKETKR